MTKAGMKECRIECGSDSPGSGGPAVNGQPQWAATPAVRTLGACARGPAAEPRPLRGAGPHNDAQHSDGPADSRNGSWRRVRCVTRRDARNPDLSAAGASLQERANNHLWRHSWRIQRAPCVCLPPRRSGPLMTGGPARNGETSGRRRLLRSRTGRGTVCCEDGALGGPRPPRLSRDQERPSPSYP